jgi:hypothetical protein
MSAWQPIETAPKGARGYAWMMLCWGREDGLATGTGFHAEGRFFAAATFFKPSGFPAFEHRQIEVFPTHWMPIPQPPEVSE